MSRIKIIGLLFVCAYSMSAQTSFYNGTQDILGNQKVKSTIAIAIDDINGDQKDDLILLDQGKFIKTFTQTSSSTPFTYKNHTQTSANGEWAVVTGDLNNDGIPEIVASGIENGSEILFFDDDYYTTVQITSAIYSQNTNLVDFNNDGFLDLFVCNDVGENQTYVNNGEGKMIKELIIDFKTSEEDDMSGNYSSIFTDIDNDGDLDLYIGKCRAGVSDPTDRRRVNTLYINNNDGTYTESAEEFGLANGSQTWSVDAGDVDNDGDIDVLIANHDREHDLMLNDGEGHFTRFGGLPAESKSFAYQSFFADFDNNGWLDIFITEPAKSYILYNNEMKFSQYDMKQGGKRAFSGAIGDFNSDGYLDLYLGFADSFQATGNKSDVVALNEGGVNNYLDINLIGTNSNRDAIGAKVTINYFGGSQVREITAGKSYGIMNSTVAHFGLGDIEFIQSIEVDWPSGFRSTFDDFYYANNFITITEDGCLSNRLKLHDYELCSEDLITIELDEIFETYLWSDGSTGPTFTTANTGSYHLTATKNGCETTSSFFDVRIESKPLSDELIYAESYFGCVDEVLKLSTIPGITYEWSNGATTQEIYLDKSDSYKVTVSTNCNSYISDEVIIDFIGKSEEVIEDTVLIGEQATLTLSGEEVKWYREFHDEVIIATGNNYITVPLMRDTIFYAGNTVSNEGIGFERLAPVPLNSSFDDQFVGNDTLAFKVHGPIYLSTLSLRTQISGIRTIELWKGHTLIKSITNDFIAGKNVISFDHVFQPGNYELTTNQDRNILELGTEDPQFSYSDKFIGFDKVISGYLKIGESVKNPGVIPYFFEWQVNYDYSSCEIRYPIKATVKDGVSTIENQLTLDLYPNPSSGFININIDFPAVAEIWQIDGKKVIRSRKLNVGKNSINTHLISGTYILKLMTNNHVISKLLIIE